MRVYSQLFSLDSSGILREYIYSNNTKEIKKAIEDIVTPFYVDVIICYSPYCEIKEYSGRTYIFDYFLSGNENFRPAKLKVVIHE